MVSLLQDVLYGLLLGNLAEEDAAQGRLAEEGLERRDKSSLL